MCVTPACVTTGRDFAVLRTSTEPSVLLCTNYHYSFFPGATQPIVGVYFTSLYRALASSRTSLLDHTRRRATVGRTPLDK